MEITVKDGGTFFFLDFHKISKLHSSATNVPVHILQVQLDLQVKAGFKPIQLLN